MSNQRHDRDERRRQWWKDHHEGLQLNSLAKDIATQPSK